MTWRREFDKFAYGLPEEFVKAAKKRMAQGEVEYGNQTFTASPADIETELAEEALDAFNYAFIRWNRDEEIKWEEIATMAFEMWGKINE